VTLKKNVDYTHLRLHSNSVILNSLTKVQNSLIALFTTYNSSTLLFQSQVICPLDFENNEVQMYLYLLYNVSN